MRTHSEIVTALQHPGVIAVVRLKSADHILPISEALIAGGVIAVEITMTTPNALQAITECVKEFGDRALIGVGTLTTAAMAQASLDAGAQFGVSPILRPEIATIFHDRQKPVMLGAYTPTEAQLAYEAGSDFVKIFPADTLGPLYIKAIKGPLPHLKIVPTGGVDLPNIGEFFRAGCSAVGVGSSLLLPKLIDAADWPALSARAKAFVEAVARAG